MKGATTGKPSKTEPRTNWKRVRSMTDRQIHAAVVRDPDVVPTDEAFWAKGHVVMPDYKRKAETSRTD
jgi:hypothetical protein